MSMSPENYGAIGKRYENLIERVDLYLAKHELGKEPIEPIIFIDEIEVLMDEINQKKGEIGLGMHNLKTEKRLSKYQEMLDALNLRLEQLKFLKHGKFFDTPNVTNILNSLNNPPNNSGILS